MSDSEVKFWIQDPMILIKDFGVLPREDDSLAENLNHITTLVVLVAAIAALLGYELKYVAVGLLVAVVAIIAIAKTKGLKEGFATNPHHVDDLFIRTNVTPLVAEEWQLNPPAYELVSDIAGDGRDFTEPVYGKEYRMEPPLAPYAQYITRTNLLPSDEAEVSLFDGGATGARFFMNDAFTRHDLAFKENMTRLYKKKLDRRFRNLGYDVISPYTSF